VEVKYKAMARMHKENRITVPDEVKEGENVDGKVFFLCPYHDDLNTTTTHFLPFVQIMQKFAVSDGWQSVLVQRYCRNWDDGSRLYR
jgi:hypothetical protein